MKALLSVSVSVFKCGIIHIGYDDKGTVEEGEEGENEHKEKHEMQDVTRRLRDQQEIRDKEKEATQESEGESDVGDHEEIVTTVGTQKRANQWEDGGSEVTPEVSRELRKRSHPTYDQVRRRTHTREEYKAIYIERRDGRRTNKRRAVIMGTTAIEHTVAGTYEWRDEALRATRGERKRYWEVINSQEDKERRGQWQRARCEQ